MLATVKHSCSDRAEDAPGTPTQIHISPNILVYEDDFNWQKLFIFNDFPDDDGADSEENFAISLENAETTTIHAVLKPRRFKNDLYQDTLPQSISI